MEERIEIKSLLKWELCHFDDGENMWFTINGKTFGEKRFNKLVENNGPLMYCGYKFDNLSELWWIHNVVLEDEILNEAVQKCPKGVAKDIPEHIRKKMNQTK